MNYDSMHIDDMVRAMQSGAVNLTEAHALLRAASYRILAVRGVSEQTPRVPEEVRDPSKPATTLMGLHAKLSSGIYNGDEKAKMIHEYLAQPEQVPSQLAVNTDIPRLLNSLRSGCGYFQVDGIEGCTATRRRAADIIDQLQPNELTILAEDAYRSDQSYLWARFSGSAIQGSKFTEPGETVVYAGRVADEMLEAFNKRWPAPPQLAEEEVAEKP